MRNFPDTRKEDSFSNSLYHEEAFLKKFHISVPHTRNDKLCGLVGEVFYQVGHQQARGLAAAQFHRKSAPTKATEEEHLKSFEDLWQGLTKGWLTSLSSEETEVFYKLTTENGRDTFRIIRSFAQNAQKRGESEFPIARNNLGERLGITGKGAAGIRDELDQLAAIDRTKEYIPNRQSARYVWLLQTPQCELSNN